MGSNKHNLSQPPGLPSQRYGSRMLAGDLRRLCARHLPCRRDTKATLPSGSHKTVAWHCQKLGVRVGTMQPQRRISGVANDTIYFCPQEQSEWTPQTPNSSTPVQTTAPAAPQPTTTVHSTCTPSLQPPKARTPTFSPQTGNHRNYTNAFSYTCYTPPEKGSAAPGRSPYNPGAGHAHVPLPEAFGW